MTLFNSFIFTFLKRNIRWFSDKSDVGPLSADFVPRRHSFLSRFVNVWSEVYKVALTQSCLCILRVFLPVTTPPFLHIYFYNILSGTVVSLSAADLTSIVTKTQECKREDVCTECAFTETLSMRFVSLPVWIKLVKLPEIFKIIHNLVLTFEHAYQKACSTSFVFPCAI